MRKYNTALYLLTKVEQDGEDETIVGRSVIDFSGWSNRSRTQRLLCVRDQLATDEQQIRLTRMRSEDVRQLARVALDTETTRNRLVVTQLPADFQLASEVAAQRHTASFAVIDSVTLG